MRSGYNNGFEAALLTGINGSVPRPKLRDRPPLGFDPQCSAPGTFGRDAI